MLINATRILSGTLATMSSAEGDVLTTVAVAQRKYAPAMTNAHESDRKPDISANINATGKLSRTKCPIPPTIPSKA
jgi:hypothetical protein